VTTTTQHAEQRVARVHPALAPYVASCVGYHYEGFPPGSHAGLPSRTLTCILTIDEPLDLATLPDRRPGSHFDALVGGLHATPAEIRHDGRQFGLQLGFTPAGARALLGMPAGELAGAVQPLDAVLPVADELLARVRDATDWRGRFAAVDAVLLAAVRDRARVPERLDAAWSILVERDGAVRVDEVAEAVGWSRRHLAERFEREYGLAPKTAARVMRFEFSRSLVQSPAQPSLAAVAAACGYSDQSHLTREWVELAGTTPGAWRAGEELPFVQDDEPDAPA
jgi:AraC-like DNA-binding protein